MTGSGAGIFLIPEAIIRPERGRKAFGGTVLEPKGELHVTLLGGEAGRRLRASMTADASASAAIRDAVNDKVLRFVRTGEWHVAEVVDYPDGPKRFRRSVVERVEIPDVDGFYRGLASVLPANVLKVFEPPPHHITLYTFHCPEEKKMERRGIGLYSADDWDKNVHWPVESSDLRAA